MPIALQNKSKLMMEHLRIPLKRAVSFLFQRLFFNWKNKDLDNVDLKNNHNHFLFYFRRFVAIDNNAEHFSNT